MYNNSYDPFGSMSSSSNITNSLGGANSPMYNTAGSVYDPYSAYHKQIAPAVTPSVPAPAAPVMNTNYQNTNQSYGPALDMQSLMQKISSTNPTVTTRTTQNVAQNASPQLQQLMDSFNSGLNTLNQNTQSAFNQKYNTYGDLISQLTNLYGAMGSGQSGAAQTSALASGLSPLEAQQAGGSAMQQVMQQYFPALAQTQTQRADVPIALQGQLANIQQALELPFIQNVESPYYQSIAGQSTTQNQSNTDPLRGLNMLSGMQQFGQSNALDWARLQQQNQQFGQTLAQNYALQGNDIQAQMQRLLQGQQSTPYQQAGLSTEMQKTNINAALQAYLQQLQGQQQLGQIGMSGMNNLMGINAQTSGQSRLNQETFNRQQQQAQAPVIAGKDAVSNTIHSDDNGIWGFSSLK